MSEATKTKPEIQAPVRKTVTARMDAAHTKDLGDGLVEVIVSTNSVDRHGERLDIEGLDLSKYNGIVLLNHDYGSLPIGKSVMLEKQIVGGVQKLVSRTQFAIDEYPLAKTVYELVKGGYMPDVSIGFIAYMWDSETDTWVKSEMIEYSHVTVGANPDAKVTAKALASVNKTQEQFDDEVKDAIAAEKLAVETVVKDNQPTISDIVQALKSLTSAFETHISAASEAEIKGQPEVRRVKLVAAKKTAQGMDKVAELLIQGLKESIK